MTMVGTAMFVVTVTAPAAAPECTTAACANAKRTGAAAYDHYGVSVACVGKINSDSKDDIVVGAWGCDAGGSDAGRVYALRGPALPSLYSLTGAKAGDRFGWAVAGGIDVNHDGRDDIIVGAPYNDDAGSNAGRVYAYSGRTRALLWTRTGTSASERFGWSLAAIGDVNHDGIDDVIVGAPFNNVHGADTGRAYVLSGADGRVLWTVTGEHAGDLFGTSVVGVKDLDDDGFDDFAVGAPGYDKPGLPDSGRVYVYSGRDKSSLQIIDGESFDNRLGTSLASRQFRFHGETISYLLAGIPNDSQSGHHAGHFHVYVRNHDHPNCITLMCEYYLGFGEAAGDYFGTSVAMGQFAGNSIPDFVVGAPKNNANGANSGAVYVFSSDEVPTACCSEPGLVRKISGEAAGDQFGASVAVADVNGDGKDDIIVGAPYNDARGTDCGRVYVFYGAP